MLINPITGVGIGNFGWYHASIGEDWTDAHNLVGKLVGELGLLGVAAFIFFIIRFVQNIKYIRMKYLKSDKPPDFLFYITEAIRIGVIMLFVQGMFGHNLYRDNWYLFAAFTVIMVNILSSKKPPTAVTQASRHP
jgi:O-antigen ligase